MDERNGHREDASAQYSHGVRLTVIGTGYLGATHAACMADLGHEVLGFDVDQHKIEQLSQGQVPFFEPGLPEVLQRALTSGRLRFTTDMAEVAAFADVHFVCVGTPQRPNSNAADMSQVDAAVAALVKHLNKPSLVIGKSTVPVGTAQRLQDLLEPAGSEVAWNPEFLREGFAVSDTLDPDRIVIGVASAAAEATVREIYEPMLAKNIPLIVTDFATAELVKVAANSFLATKISFINAMAEVCEASGADVKVLAEAIGYDNRIGHRFLRAGIGFGGGCLPKDIRAFMARAGELGADEALTFLKEVDAINLRRRRNTVDLAASELGGSFTNKTVTVLGVTFKPDSDDVRDSPALDIAAEIHARGGLVRVHDPKGIENARKRFPTLNYFTDVADACKGAELVLHLTEWKMYQELDPSSIDGTANKVIIDGRLTLDPTRWRRAGWKFKALGRPNL